MSRVIHYFSGRGVRVKLQLGRASWSVDEAIRRIETKLRTG